ncbi:hypothetical protein AAY473_025743 [Plecturocebus cupreus]
MGFLHGGQAGLELLIYSDQPALASGSAGIPGNYISQVALSFSLKRGLANERHWQKTRGQEGGPVQFFLLSALGSSSGSN